MLPARGLTNSR